MEMKKLCRIFAEVLHVDEREVTQAMTLAEDLDADSLDLYQIMLKVEEAFSIRITEKEFGRLKTVQDILHLIRRKQGDR
ncbi:MAG: acyl carrier protein [Eubacterium sp.]|nr:acyl carrier protein [Eubacterium sp.]